jgi:hypothetical protein
MPERKLSYKVDVDTGTAVSDLEKLGRAGGDAGKDIAQGFDQAETASKAALDALSAKLDEVQSDAKGAASAISAIKAHLTVDIDDDQVGAFVGDLKNKMGVAFDAVEQDAKEFAAVLERGVDLSRTTNEIKGVGAALDTTRSNADQSRSVLANLAGNTAQDLGELGGVVGTLGVGVGQLAEYAVDGNISLKNLAGLAGPMLGLAAAGAAVQDVMGNIAATKAFNAEQVQGFSDAIGELGNTSLALRQALDGVFNARVDDDSLWGQISNKQKTENLADDLANVGVQLSDIDDIIRSGASDRASFEMLPGVQDLDRVLQAAGVSVDQYGDIMDGVYETTLNYTTATKGAAAGAEFFGSSLASINDAIAAADLAEDPLARLDWGLYVQAGGALVDLKAIWNDVVRDMADGGAEFDTTAGNVDILAEALHLSVDEVIALAREQTTTTKTTGELGDITKTAADAQGELSDAVQADIENRQGQVDAMQAVIDKNEEMIDAAHGWADAQQEFRDATEDLPQMLAETNAAMANNLKGTEEYIDAQREQRDGAIEWIDLMVSSRQEYDKGRGVIRSAAQTQADYTEGLGRMAGHLNADVIPAVAAYYANLLLIPEDKITEFEMVLATGDQEEIATFVAENSGTKTMSMIVTTNKAQIAEANRQIQAVGDGASATVTAHADTQPAKNAMSGFRNSQEGTPVYVPVRPLWSSLWSSPPVSGYSKSVPSSASVSTMAAPAATDSTTAPTLPSSIAVPMPALPAPSITVNLQAGVVGNRYDLQRWLRAGLRDQQRLGRLSQVVPA